MLRKVSYKKMRVKRIVTGLVLTVALSAGMLCSMAMPVYAASTSKRESALEQMKKSEYVKAKVTKQRNLYSVSVGKDVKSLVKTLGGMLSKDKVLSSQQCGNYALGQYTYKEQSVLYECKGLLEYLNGEIKSKRKVDTFYVPTALFGTKNDLAKFDDDMIREIEEESKGHDGHSYRWKPTKATNEATSKIEGSLISILPRHWAYYERTENKKQTDYYYDFMPIIIDSKTKPIEVGKKAGGWLGGQKLNYHGMLQVVKIENKYNKSTHTYDPMKVNISWQEVWFDVSVSE